MAIRNVFAGVAVSDLNKARQWYSKLLGGDGNQPMEEVVEWEFAGGGTLQVFADQDRAGKSSET